MNFEHNLEYAINEHQAGNLTMAEKAYLNYLNFNSTSAVALGNLGALYSQIGQYQKSIDYIHKSLAQNQNQAGAWSNLGIAYKNIGKYQKAIDCHHEAIRLNDPKTLPDAYYNLGIAYIENSNTDEGIDAFTKAIELNPKLSKAYNNRGLAYASLGQFEQAISSYQKAIAIDPENPRWYWNLSLIYLLLGNYRKGLPLYEYRQKLGHADFERQFIGQRWDKSQSLQGKSLLIYAEQGFGDCIQFSRYALLAKERGANVILEVFPELLETIKTIGDGIDVVSLKQNTRSYDFYLPMLSAPLEFETSVKSIPKMGQYLSAPLQKSKLWKIVCGENSQYKVGIAWCGRPTHKDDKARSIVLSQFIQMFPKDVRLYSLQKEYRREDQVWMKQNNIIIDHADVIKDYADTAAIIEQMDLIVTVDTSVAHLAAALGKPTWILLAFVPDWRWGLKDSSTAWYDNVRLYRQANLGDWASVFEQIKQDISILTQTKNTKTTDINETLSLSQLTPDQAKNIQMLKFLDAEIQRLYQQIEVTKKARLEYINSARS